MSTILRIKLKFKFKNRTGDWLLAAVAGFGVDLLVAVAAESLVFAEGELLVGKLRVAVGTPEAVRVHRPTAHVQPSLVYYLRSNKVSK